MKRNKDKKYIGGFTLIELLVVIAIIAILSTVVMAGLNSARLKGRDAKRLSDVKQIQSALEIFLDTCGSGYPNNAASLPLTVPTPAWGDTSAAAGNCIYGADMETFLNPSPVNPGPGGTAYGYCSTGGVAAAAATFAAPACNTPLTARDAYSIVFSLEGQSGSLGLGGHVATPNGIR